MATVQLMSSPLAHRQAGARLFNMDSNSSPLKTNQDLPDAFDTSFGSQMSISSNDRYDSNDNDQQHQHSIHQRQYENNTLRVHSPLGPALGTQLNSKSPGLAAKLNSSTSTSSSNSNLSIHPMDISPSPSFQTNVNHQRPRSSTISSDVNRNGTSSRRAQRFSESNVSSKSNHSDSFGNGNENNPSMSMSDVSMASLSKEGVVVGSTNGAGGKMMSRKSKDFNGSSSTSSNSSGNGSASSSSSPALSTKVKPKSRSNSSSSGSVRGGARNRSSSTSIEKPRDHGDGEVPQCPPSAGSSLGRLFGMELSLNDHDEDEENRDGPGSESAPTLKRRPSSLPLGGGSHLSRPSIAGSGILSASSNARPRPTLMQSFTSKAGSGDDRTVRKQASVDSLSPNYFSNPASGSSSNLGRPARARGSSVESVFDAPPQGSHPDLLTRASLGYVSSAHDTIIESPSPAALERKDGLSDYFFDPQSPEHQQQPSQPSRPVSRASGSSGKRSNSPPTNAARRPGPRPSLGIRKLEKAHSSVILPTRSALNSNTSSGPGTTRTLGKRSNPYGSGSRNSAHGASSRQIGGSTQLGPSKGNADPIKRLTAPAPRRTQSASDYSSALNSLLQKSNENQGSNLADVSMSSSNADSSMDQSPLRKRTMIGNDYPDGFDNGSPMTSAARGKLPRPSMLRTSSKDDASPLGYGSGLKRSNSRTNNLHGVGEDDSMVGVSTTNSPGIPSSPFMPGFGASEREGKILPCFSVSNDGLMRISTDTMKDLIEGKFDQDIESYHIIDCRFAYEFEGGHIPGAINLNTLEKVKNHFLSPNQGLHYPDQALPSRSQSGKPDKFGNLKKTVLVFHCEFSAKRAPSMALALRQADRSLQSDYPNCHFPEIYIMKGGYCEFFKDYKEKSNTGDYVRMDDPRFQIKCSNELGAYRKQFERHRSFTYGETKNQASSSNPLLQHGVRFGDNNGSKRRSGNSNSNNNNGTIKEDERDTSNASNSSNSNVEDSPSMAVIGRKTNSLQPGNGLGTNLNRPPLNSRGFTLGPNTNLTKTLSSSSNPFNEALSQSNSNVSMMNADLQDVSFSSSTGDSSFDAVGDSPCAAASKRPSLMLPPSATSNSSRLSASIQPQLGRLKLQRAGTTPNVLNR